MAKVQFGLKNVHIAPITIGNDNSVTYATPFALPGAVSLSLSPSGDENVFYADDIRYYVIAGNGSYEGNMVIAMVTDKFAKDILGYKEDTNHLLVEDASVQPKSFAMTFEVQNDVSATKYVLYNVSVGRADLSANTKEESVEVQTATLDITCSGAVDTGYVRAYTTENTPTGVVSAWDTTIQVPTFSA